MTSPIAGFAPLALATCRYLPDLPADEQRLPALMRELGVEAEPVVWDDPGVDWRRYRAVVIRSTWDYHLNPGAFLAWIERLGRDGIGMLNPGPILRWNADKRYLLELARRGVAVVPTAWAPAGGDGSLADIAAARGWTRVVVKPAISASAAGTWTAEIPCTAEDEERFRAGRAVSDLLVQPFLATVCQEGEWSLVFFEGRFSHAVLKRPRPGDFRVQEAYGGRWAAAEPGPALVAAGRAILEAIPFPASSCLYARVDGVELEGVFHLMELELLEPALFLSGSPGGSERFAGAIERALRRQGARATRHRL